jgi:hypothetical protein
MIGRDWAVPFALVRHDDPSNVSGTGTVAMGVIWPDRRAVFRWSGVRPPAGHHVAIQQLCMFDDVEQIAVVHGHQGATVLETRDPMAGCADLGMQVFGIVGTYGLQRRVAYWGIAYERGPAVTWRADENLAPRIEQWPAGAASAWAELRDGETAAADEVRLAWVPEQAPDLVNAHPVHRLSGRVAIPRNRIDVRK